MNNRLALATALLCLILPTNSFAKDRYLQGRVLLVGERDELNPVVGQDVILVESGDTARTKDGGRFRIFLKDIFNPGSRITLALEKKGWRVQYPLDGEARVPDNLEKELVEVRLLRIGSKKFWSADRIEKFIQDMAEKAKAQVTPEGKPQDVDFGRYIKEWAVRYGFSPQQAKAEMDKWVAEAEQKSDPYQLGLAAYAKKNFGEAGKLFEASAGEKVLRAHEASATAQQFTEEAIRDFGLAGNAHTNNYRFDQALVAYRKATELISRKDQPRLWAYHALAVGAAAHQIGIRTEGDAIQQHLNNAVDSYQAALTIYTKESLPQQWAATQNNLGNVLRDQGSRTDGEAGTQLFAQAVEAYHAALTVYTYEQLPQRWAMTQNNLGNLLGEQGTRTGEEAGTRLLAKAVEAYRDALTVHTKGSLPQDWAMTQNNLGNLLGEQGTRTGGEAGTRLLAQAVAAYRAALTVYTKDQLPQPWATTQNNLGNVLSIQGIRTEGEAGTRLLAQAVTTFQAALTVHTKELLPQDWAGTQNNLGATLQEQGTRTGGEAGKELICQAIQAYELALQIRTKDALPVEWEKTMGNLKIAKQALEDMK